MVTIVVADDHKIVRQGIKLILEREKDLSVVGEADDGVEALRLVQLLKPSVLVLDLALPGLSGLDVLRDVRQRSTGTLVVVLSMHCEEEYVREALVRGASAYVTKNAGGSEILEAVRHVVKGEKYLSPPLSERAIEAYAISSRGGRVDPYDLLTTREREALQLAAEGKSNAEIGAHLFISPRTVEIHRAHGMRKLGLGSYVELLRYALRRGLISWN